MELVAETAALFDLLTSGNKFCRACLSAEKGTVYVEIGDSDRYFHELNIADLKLPGFAKLCEDCDQKIVSTLALREKVLHSTSILRSIIESIDNLEAKQNDTKNDIKMEHSDDEKPIYETDYVWETSVKDDFSPAHLTDDIFDEDDLLPLKRTRSERLSAKSGARSLSRKRKKDRKNRTIQIKEDKRTALTADDKLKCVLVCLSEAEQREELSRKVNEKKFINSLYKCDSCYKGFCFEETHKKHMTLHEPSNGPYKCDICLLYFNSKNYYMSHLLRHSKRFKCLRCNAVKCTRKDLLEHFGAEHEADAARRECQYCGKLFLKPTILRQHINRRHRNSNVRQACEHCGKTFRTKEILRRHLLQHTTRDLPEKEKRFQCGKCGDRFITPTFLRIHEVKHSSDRNFYCTLCDTYFKSQTILKSHLKYSSRHADINKTVPCERCDKKLSSQRELEKHIEKDHLGIANFKCELCPKAYYTNNLLRMHVRRVHEKYRPPMKHVCDYCGKTFNVRSTLIGHINTHTGEKPFECKECEARFGHSAALYTHVRLIHRKMKRDEKGRFHSTEPS